MQKRSPHSRSFRQIVASEEPRNAARLMARASIANRIAKMSFGHPRQGAYRVKTQALTGLAERFPDRVSVAIDYNTPGFVLVTVPREQFGLHAPAALFAQPVRVARAA